MILRGVVLALALVSLIGCATTSRYTLEVDSIADTEADGDQTFVIQSGMKDVSTNDLRFKEYSKIVRNSLAKKGYKQTSDVKKADMIVMLSYGISDPNTKTYTRSVPVYGGNGTTTTLTNNYGQKIGSFQTQPSNPYAPSGYRSVTDEVTTYNRFVVLTAYDAKGVLKLRSADEKFDPKMIWETKVTSTGSSGDLRKVFPVMMLGAIPYIGRNSGKQQIINLDLNDEEDPRLLDLVSGNEGQSNRAPASKRP